MEGYGNPVKVEDLSDYAKKTDVPTNSDFESLVKTVANKIDAKPPHTHEISQINELSKTLAGKLASDTKYNYSSILSNPEEINFLKQLETLGIKLVPSKAADGYTFDVDSVGDLRIIYKDDVIMNYDAVNMKWLIDDIDIKEVLQNHTDALKILLPEEEETN